MSSSKCSSLSWVHHQCKHKLRTFCEWLWKCLHCVLQGDASLLCLLSESGGRQSVLTEKPLRHRHCVTPVILYNRWHVVAPSLVPTHIPTALNVNQVSYGPPVNSPTLWKFSGRNVCSDIEELKEANKILFLVRNSYQLQVKFWKGYLGNTYLFKHFSL